MSPESNLIKVPSARWGQEEAEDWESGIDSPGAETPSTVTFESVLEALHDVEVWDTALERVRQQLSASIQVLWSPLQLTDVESRLAELEARFENLENRPAGPVTARVHSLDPEPFELTRDIEVVIQTSGEGFVATFLDADLAMSGDTQSEALENLKMLMVDVFEQFNELGEGKLGPGLQRQFRVLRSLMRARVEWED